MNALTVRGLDDDAINRLKAEARRVGVSVNVLIQRLLRQGLGLDKPARPVRHSDLDHLAGTWSAAEAKQFGAAVAPFESVDQEMWR